MSENIREPHGAASTPLFHAPSLTDAFHDFGAVHDSIEGLAENICDIDDTASGEGTTLIDYKAALEAIPGRMNVPPLFTEITIEMTQHTIRPPFTEAQRGMLQKEYVVVLCNKDIRDRVVYENEYRLRRFVGGAVTMDIMQAFDSVAEALVQQKPDLIGTESWRPATGYEARRFRSEIDQIRTLPPWEP